MQNLPPMKTLALLFAFGVAFGSTAALAQSSSSVLSGNSFGQSPASTGSTPTAPAASGLKTTGKAKGTVFSKKIGGSVYDPTVGTITGEGNAARGCAAGANVLNAKASVNVGASAKTGARSGSTGSKCGAVGSGTGANAEIGLVSVQGKCATALGTVGANGRALTASASIGPCGAEAKADLIYGEATYDSPTVGACGSTLGVSASGGAGVGVGIGAKKQGSLGGLKLRGGPFSVGLGLNGNFSGSGALKCLGDAWKSVTSFLKPPKLPSLSGLFGGGKSDAPSGGWFQP